VTKRVTANGQNPARRVSVQDRFGGIRVLGLLVVAAAIERLSKSLRFRRVAACAEAADAIFCGQGESELMAELLQQAAQNQGHQIKTKKEYYR
jgi:hypothetical protein